MSRGSTGRLPSEAAPALHAATLVAVALAVVVPVLVIAPTRTPPGNYWLGSLIILVISGLRYSWIVGSRSRRLFEMVFWLFAYIFLGLAPLVQLRLQEYAATTPIVDESFLWTASALVIAGLCAALAGSTVAGRQQSQIGPPATRRGVSTARVALLAYTMTVLSFAYIAAIGIGSLLSYRSSLDEARMAVFRDTTVVAVVEAVIGIGLLVSFLAQLQLRRERTTQGIAHHSPMLWLTGILMLVCVNPVSSARYLSGTVLLAALVGLGLCSSVGRFRALATSAVIAMILVFPMADAFRWSGQVDFGTTNVLESLTSGDFDAFPQTVNTVNYVDANGITWGRQAMGALLFWVPRRLWPDKPLDTGPLVAEFQGYDYTNLSSPLVAELFINGGWVVVAIGMALLGWVLRRWDDLNEVMMQRDGVPSVIFTIAPFYMLIMLRGSLLQSMHTLAVILVCGWFVYGRQPGLGRDAPQQELGQAQRNGVPAHDGRSD